jgi:hypothetical protein
VDDNDRSADTMQLVVSAAPPEAKIEIDGFEKGGNPLWGRFKKDGEEHRVRVYAAGYQERKLLVTFDGDRALDVTLEPLSATPAADAAAAPVAPPDAATKSRPPVRPRADTGGAAIAPPPPPPPPPAADAGATRDGFREFDPTKLQRPPLPSEDNPYGVRPPAPASP